MKLSIALSIVALAAAGAASAAQGVDVSAAWSRPAVAGSTGAGFMTLTNRTSRADALVAVESPVARKVEIHVSEMRSGMASMKRLDRVPLPPGGSVTFRPGGHHLMFLGLNRPLKSGETLPATLTFASGAKVKASFVVGLSAPAHQH